MKKEISPFVIAGIAAAAVAVLVFFFMQSNSGPAPTASNLPDYSKMSSEDIAKSKEADMDAERNAQRPQ